MSSRKIAKYDPELGQVVWYEVDDRVPESKAPAVFGCIEFRAVGLPGQPIITSRGQYKQLLKRHNCVEVGNDPAAMPPQVREELRK